MSSTLTLMGIACRQTQEMGMALNLAEEVEEEFG